LDHLGIVQRLGQQRFIQDLAEALAAVSDEVVLTGNKGAVTVTFAITTTEKGDPMVTINETIACKPPSKASRGSWLFSNGQELSPRDSRQAELDFRALRSEQSELRRRIDDDDTEIRSAE
jgi:hypothetical protein